ncbi:uncharacterized protein LOC123540928 [Mercenaria mercenaria]|uniref:uncharacterized protein LOC123540928 n=1 Tax=Mercenaria mercenaria TaxID=6596 RepID=UPI00234E9193|nr:uncharacterized protein LOC123540928 [Mercenaria mercenaria]
MDDNYMDISRDLDDARSFTEDVTFPFQKEVFSTYMDVDAEDNIEKSKGLDEEYLLDNIELNKLCTNEGRTSPNVKKECDKICTAIKTKSDKIVHVVPAYKTNDETKIIFVVFAQSEITLETRWKLEVRIVYQYSDESKCAMYCANNNPLSTESSRKIGKIIDKYSMELMHNHTYLSVISASPVVSKHYGTSNYKTESVSCIALYVIVKHFIPINEEPFPQMLDGIPVDVREGGVQFCGASAEDFHDQVRMGCKITSTFQPQKHGTLGGFVEHPDYGLCGITCAHVVLNDKWKFALKEKMKVKEKEMEPCALFQPSYDRIKQALYK